MHGTRDFMAQLLNTRLLLLDLAIQLLSCSNIFNQQSSVLDHQKLWHDSTIRQSNVFINANCGGHYLLQFLSQH